MIDDACVLRGCKPDHGARQPACRKHVREQPAHRMTDDQGLPVELADFAGQVGDVVGKARGAEVRVRRAVGRPVVMAERGHDDAVVPCLEELTKIVPDMRTAPHAVNEHDDRLVVPVMDRM